MIAKMHTNIPIKEQCSPLKQNMGAGGISQEVCVFFFFFFFEVCVFA
jgi:hypothetical protein